MGKTCSELDFAQLEQRLRKVLTDDLAIVASMTLWHVEPDGVEVTLQLTAPFTAVQSPILSSIAVALMRNAGQPVTLTNHERFESGMIHVFFRFLEV
jgi:hypothetical protein